MKELLNLFLVFLFIYMLPLIYRFVLYVDNCILEIFRKKVLKDKSKRNDGSN